MRQPATINIKKHNAAPVVMEKYTMDIDTSFYKHITIDRIQKYISYFTIGRNQTVNFSVTDKVCRIIVYSIFPEAEVRSHMQAFIDKYGMLPLNPEESMFNMLEDNLSSTTVDSLIA